MPTLALVWDLIARDGASATFARVGSAAEGTAAKTEAASAAVGKLGGAFAAFAGGAAIVASVKAAEQFQAKMLLIQTQAGATSQEVRDMSPAILSLAGKVAQAPEELATSLYHVESTGLRGAQALEAVKIAAEGARVGHADLEQTTNALTATIASGMLPATESYAQAMGQLNTIVGSGDMQMQDLNDALGTGLLVTVKQYGVSMNDVGAALADFGDNNIRGADAATKLRMAVQGIVSPAAGADDVLARIGLTTQNLRDDMANGGLNGALTDLHDHFVSSGIDANQWGQMMTDAFTKKAGAGILTLVGTFDRFQQKYQEVSDGADGFGAAWEATTHSAAFQFAALKDSIDAVGIEFGTYLLPILGKLAEGFTGLFSIIGDVVGFFASLPGPVQAGVAAFGLFLLLRGPLSSFFETVALKAMYMAEAVATAAGEASFSMATLGAAGEGVMAMFGGPWGLAITGVTVGLGYLISWLGKSDGATADVTSATQDYAQALAQANGVITENVRQHAAQDAQKAGILDYLESQGIATDQVTEAITRQGPALDNYMRQLENIAAFHDHRLTQDDPHVYDAEGQAAANAAAALAGLAGQTTTTTDDQAQLGRALGDTGDAATAATPAAQELSDKLTAIGDAASSAKQQTDALKSALDILTGAQISTTQAESDFYAAVDAAHGAMDGLNGSVLDGSGALNTQSESGRKAFDILNSIRDADNQVIATMEQHGATTDEVTARDAELRQSFIDSEAQMGITGQAAQDLADQILGIPDQRNIEIGADTSTAEQKINDFVAGLGLQGLTPLIGITQWNIPNHAAGGPISGPGTGTSDSILARVSNGEFVVKASQTAKHLPLLHAINSGAPGFADGGLIDFVEHADLSAQTQARMASAKASMTAAQSAASAAAPGAPVNTKGNATLVQRLAAARGWGSGPEWNALYALVNRESGFRNTAQNPTSTAYGLFQFLDSTWASYGKKTSDAGAQTKMGLSYIADRYGDPIGAWGHESRFGWYKDGTNYVPNDQFAYLHQGEAVVPASANQGAPYQSQPAQFTGNLYLDSGEFMGVVRGQAEQVVAGALTAGAARRRFNG